MTERAPDDQAHGCWKAGRCVFPEDPPAYCRSWCRTRESVFCSTCGGPCADCRDGCAENIPEAALTAPGFKGVDE